jgi:hypothetical protein
VSEKLNAFIALFNERVDADISKAQSKIEKAQEKLDEAEKIWNEAQEGLSGDILENFLEVFPAPTGGAQGNAITGVDPRFVNLLEFGDPLKSQARQLFKLRYSDQRMIGAQNYLQESEKLKEEGAELTLSRLSNKLTETALRTQSLGGSNVDSLIKRIFEDYESFEDVAYSELNDVSSPSQVTTSQEAYEALKEKMEGASQGEEVEPNEEETSPLNEPESLEEEVSSDEEISPINPAEDVEPEEVTTEVSTTGPEIEQAEETPSEPIVANINLEQPDLAEDLEEPEEVQDQQPAVSPISEISSNLVEDNVTEVSNETSNINNTTTNVTGENTAVNNNTNVTSEKPKVSSLKDFISKLKGLRDSLNPESSPGDAETLEIEKGGNTPSISNIFEGAKSVVADSFEGGDIIGGITDVVSNTTNLNQVLESGSDSPINNQIERALSRPLSDRLPEGFSMDSATDFIESKTGASIPSVESVTSNISETVERSAKSLSSPITNISNISERSESNTEGNQISNISEVDSSTSTESNSVSTSTNTSSSNTKNEENVENNSSSSSMTSMPTVDNSEIVSRLKKLERLLSGPLEVKIVE